MQLKGQLRVLFCRFRIYRGTYDMGHKPLKVIYIFSFSFSFSTLRLTQVGDISQGSDTEQGVGGGGMLQDGIGGYK